MRTATVTATGTFTRECRCDCVCDRDHAEHFGSNGQSFTPRRQLPAADDGHSRRPVYGRGSQPPCRAPRLQLGRNARLVEVSAVQPHRYADAYYLAEASEQVCRLCPVPRGSAPCSASAGPGCSRSGQWERHRACAAASAAASVCAGYGRPVAGCRSGSGAAVGHRRGAGHPAGRGDRRPADLQTRDAVGAS